jgi:alcohol dehydrogenase class IV
LRRIALFTDRQLKSSPYVATVRASLEAAKVDVALYDSVDIEPTDASFQDAARFAADGKFDGYVSVGGGSVMDTCKAANLYASHPAEFMTYVNAPIGAGQKVPGAVRPHIACPTTCGTGSETTGSPSSTCARSTPRPASFRVDSFRPLPSSIPTSRRRCRKMPSPRRVSIA